MLPSDLPDGHLDGDQVSAEEILGSAQIDHVCPPKTMDVSEEGASPSSAKSEPVPVQPHQASLSKALSQLCTFRLTDLGNAERLRYLHGDDLRYCREQKTWYVWDHQRWAQDVTGKTQCRAFDTMRKTLKAAADLSNSQEKRALVKHALRSENASGIKAMLDNASCLPGIAIRRDQPDQSAWLFNCSNGTIDLQTGELRAHDRKDMLTQLAPEAFDPSAKCERWPKFLDQIMDGQEELVDYLQRVVGYAMIGAALEHVLIIFHGSGANGKSTFCSVLQHVFGDYAKQAAPDLLVAQRYGSGHPCDVADLANARLAINSEISVGGRLDESKVKRITGGDKIKARPLYESFIEFDARFTLVYCVNQRPEVKGGDDAIWRRIHLVPFVVTIPVEDQDKELADKLKEEASGILAWAVRGCLEWRRIGLSPPDQVLEATKEYRSDMDQILTFLDDRYEDAPGEEVYFRDLYEDYERWAETAGFDPMSKTKLGKIMRAKNYKRGKGKKGGARVYLGLRPISPGETQGQDDLSSSSVDQERESGGFVLPSACRIADFCVECLIHGKGYELPVMDLEFAYEQFCNCNGHDQLSSEDLIREVAAAGLGLKGAEEGGMASVLDIDLDPKWDDYRISRPREATGDLSYLGI